MIRQRGRIMEKNKDCCFANILKVIDVLQRNADRCESIDETCTRPFLGTFLSSAVYNTRPVTFYTKTGSIYSLPYTFNGVSGTSSVFRIEKVKDCCVTVLILAPNPSATDSRPYISTNQFATINLDCVCVLQCLADVIVDNV